MRWATVVCVGLALAWAAPLEATLAWGWDETMHVALPAWRLLAAARSLDPAGLFEALHACDRYPFAYPALVALEQGLFGVSEHGVRVLGTLVWCATLLALFAVAGRAAPERPHASWLALIAAAASPLGLSFAGTAMLEVPSAFAIAMALLAWVRRRTAAPDDERRASFDRRAGAWATLAFFTKFNYGLLLGAALALDELFELALARERKRGRAALASSMRAALWPALALAWWFLLPLPFGFDVAAEHRAAFVDWLTGNQDQAPTPWRIKLLNAGAFFAPNPRTLVVLAVGALATLPHLSRPPIRALWLALLALSFGVLSHRFHLPRFLIPLGPALWVLAAIGWARLLPHGRWLRWPATAALVAACAIAPGRDTLAFADALGFLSEQPATREYQERELATQRDLSGSRRLRSLGLAVEESRRFFEALAADVQPTERLAWLDLTEEVSPAGLQYGLSRHGPGRDRATFARQLWDENWISIGGVDPQWSDEKLLAWAAHYDVVLFSEPHHLRGRGGREFFGGYVERLERGGWTRKFIGRLSIERPMREPLEVALFTLRRGAAERK